MKRNDILIFLLCTCFATLAWIGFSIHHSLVTSTISGTLSQAIVPIKPDFDTNILDNLHAREVVTPVYTLQTLPPATQSAIASPAANVPFPIQFNQSSSPSAQSL